MFNISCKENQEMGEYSAQYSQTTKEEWKNWPKKE